MPAYYIVDAKGNVLAFPVGVADVSSLNADNLTSGTVPLARLAGITNAQIDAAAAIAYSKLALTGDIVDADIASAAAIAWSKISKSGSSLADLATRSAADLSSGNLAVARLGNGVTSITTDTSTGSVNNWAPTLAGNTFIEWSGASDATFTGLSSSGVATGAIVVIRNAGTKNAFFSHLSGSSSTANQLTNVVTTGPTPIGPGGVIAYLFNGTNWRLIAHEQGTPIAVAYSAGNFTGSGTITWSVDSADIQTYSYVIRGAQMLLTFYADTTTVSGTGTQLRVAIPGGYTTVHRVQTVIRIIDNGTSRAGLFVQIESEPYVRLECDLTDTTNWAAATDNTYVRFSELIQIS